MRIKQVYLHYDPQAQPIQHPYHYCPACGGELAVQEEDHILRSTCLGCGFVHYRNPAPAVSVLIVEEGRVVLGRRAGHPGQGKWAAPSGYVEYAEDYLAAGKREAKEETGLEVEMISILNVASSFLSERYHFIGIFLLARVVGGSWSPATTWNRWAGSRWMSRCPAWLFQRMWM